MKIILIIIFLNVLFISNVEAAFENKALNTQAEGMGGAFTAIADGSGAVLYNPAGLYQVTSQEISFFHSQPFGISELKQNVITFVLPIKKKKGGIGFSYQQLTASNDYKERLLLFGFTPIIYKNFSLGINLKQLYLKIDGYGQKTKFGTNVGGIYEFSPKIKIGFVGFNLYPVIKDVERNYNLGLSIKHRENLLIAIDLEKTKMFNFELRVGKELWVTNNLCIRAGFKKHTAIQPTLGLGISTNFVHLDYGCSFHPTLGLTHLWNVGFKPQLGR